MARRQRCHIPHLHQEQHLCTWRRRARQLYFLIGGLLKKLVHLSHGLSITLGFTR
ncbi:hypothetical protein AB0N07_27595 [Streptomyces sp. NPDC051172]|uniref:hypothetical protein n=1 Tax=Streptomyces sp. NPDC051172 TaxID=3155796 RepID=UPI0034343AE1